MPASVHSSDPTRRRFLRLGALALGSMTLPELSATGRAQAPAGARPPAQTELARLAASLKPGSWAELKTEGFTRELTRTSKQYCIFGWSDDGVWDPVTEQFLFMGFRQELKFIAYSAKTNTWRAIPAHESKAIFGHPYGHNAIDPAKGVFYDLDCGSNQIHAYDLRKNEWSKLPPCPFPCQGLAMAIEFFPEMNALVFQFGKQAYQFDLGQQKWSILAKELPTGTLHVLFHYNAKHQCLVLMGGNGQENKVAIVDAQGKVTSKKDGPVKLGMQFGKAVPDPVTGDMIVLTLDGDIYAYDLVADQWNRLGMTAKDTPLRYVGVIGAAIEKHGVTMWVEGDSPDVRRVWLYKHKKRDMPQK